MLKKKPALYILSFGILFLLCFLMPETASANTKKTVITSVTADVTNLQPMVGDPIPQYESDKPVFTVTYGSPAYFYSSGMNGVWEIYDYDTDSWSVATGVFLDKIYHYRAQVRIDGPDAQNYVLAENPWIILNENQNCGKYGKSVISDSPTNPFSYINFYTPPICPTMVYNVTINDEGENLDWSTSGTYNYGDVVILNYGTKEGMEFDHWEVVRGNVTLNDPYNPDHESFQMPNTHVEITAHWRKLLPVDEEHFPDDNFRSYVASLPQADDGYLSKAEIEEITFIDCSGRQIQSLQGIQYFTSLYNLNCSDNELEGVNVRSNPDLKILVCDNNPLIWIADFGILYTDFSCNNTHLQYLDFSDQTDLMTLSCDNNNLVYLELPDGLPYPSNFSCKNNRRPAENNISLSGALSGIDPNRIFNVKGGSVANDTITFDTNSTIITYSYRVNSDITYEFRLDRVFSPGWQNINNEYKYVHDDASVTENGWEYIDGYWYYFGTDGWMTRGWIYINGYWYYLENSGHMATGWQNIGGYWYYLNSGGSMATGWQCINGYWYYLENNGHMATGWQYIGGYWYYLNSGGSMATGWNSINGYWYYFESSGHMATGWQYIGGYWYYLNSDGSMAIGWLYNGGYWYFFDGSGHMTTGWQYIGGYWYYFNYSGQMT